MPNKQNTTEMTTIEEIENEIAALKEAMEIIEERTGDKFDNTELKKVLTKEIDALKQREIHLRMDLPVFPYEPEYEPEDEWN